jgi:hypothetical protein
MIDGLYGARNQSNNVLKYVSFGDDWSSSIFASQDPIAIDSVGLDFLRHEDGLNSAMTDVTGNPENYMHEAALAGTPPSGTVYDPEGDGTRLASLGVHEHWNNPVDKQYSRNLGTGDGIELVSPSFATVDGPIENIYTGQRYDHIRHAISDAVAGDYIVIGEGIFYENISFNGKNITISSVDPNDPFYIGSTILQGSADRPVVTLKDNSAACEIAGLTIRAGSIGIMGDSTDATIRNCRIMDNVTHGLELSRGSSPHLKDCFIVSNGQTGITMVAGLGRAAPVCAPLIENCVFVDNGQADIIGGQPVIIDSIISQ